MIDRDTLRLIPASDSRGIDIGDKAGVYVTEAQNLTIDTMQLILQRIGENCVCVIDGDSYAQVDMEIYKRSNGLEKVSEVFRGQDYYGEVTLKNCYRSKIAKRAELMRRN